MCYIAYTGLHQVTAFILHHGCNLITFQSTEHVCSGAAVGALYRFTLCVVHSWRLSMCVIWYHSITWCGHTGALSKTCTMSDNIWPILIQVTYWKVQLCLLRAELSVVLVGCAYIATKINVTSVMYGLSMRGKYSVVSFRMKMYRIPFCRVILPSNCHKYNE